jgi:hypothetical protein
MESQNPYSNEYRHSVKQGVDASENLHTIVVQSVVCLMLLSG